MSAPAFFPTQPKAIRCGNCKETHPTVEEVRACYGKPRVKPATQGQLNYCHKLLRERTTPAGMVELSEETVNAFSFDQASAFIDQMKIQPKRSGGGGINVGYEDVVPEGYYAIDGQEATEFYKVVDWDTGRKLFAVFGSPGSLEERRVKRQEHGDWVMAKIAEDPRAASLRFGSELKICGVCGSPLTNEASREIGIGPVCRRKMGW